jgi:hypothetical protein
MASKLRTKILNAKDIKSQTEPVPEWDITLEVRGLTGAQLTECNDAAQIKGVDVEGEPTTSTDNNALTRLILIRSLFDPESGEQIMEEADADALWQKSAQVLNRLALICGKLNGTAKSEEKAMEKNSDATTSAAGVSV